MVATSEPRPELFSIAQELRDQIFDEAIEDTEAIYDHNGLMATSCSGALSASKSFYTCFKSALSRRRENFTTHRFTIDFKLCTQTQKTQLPAILLALPERATGLHLIIKVHKFGIFNNTPITELNDISEPFKSLINGINVKDLLIELEVIDRSIMDPLGHSEKLKARDVYHRLIHQLESVDWKGEHKVESEFSGGAIIAHNGAGRLARKSNTAAGIITTRGLHDSTGMFHPDVEDLVTMFHCKDRITQAINDGPGPSFHNAAYSNITAGNANRMANGGSAGQISTLHAPATVQNHNALFDEFDAMF
ncbi:unnamed protein product [Zymoseptoria tritici ST99CH_1A5]|uniref:Uncharacterized protein n=1 Tax=Zymoseptoria tritici ST99CH_1A5 TaxID=1276529 RepID=A0A1Y6LPZ5_ZYMTR|nr:unnamed protein product [Zymoseptoria tritici ST99CH_1A5]